MNCPKCNAMLEDDSKFCVSCGANLENNVGDKCEPHLISAVIETNEENKFPKPQSNRAMKIGLIVGSLLIVIGLLRVFTAGTSISSTSFGGDFYTYTYQGIVAISEILASIEVTLGWVVVAIGAAIDVISLKH